MHDKHKYEGDDLKEIEYNFKKVAGKNPLRTYSFAKYSLKDEFNALIAVLEREVYKIRAEEQKSDNTRRNKE